MKMVFWDRGGFTTAEVLMAALFGMIVMGALYGFFQEQLYSLLSQEAKTATLDDGRGALDIMVRDLRNAVSDAARQLRSDLSRIKMRAVSETARFRLVFLASKYSVERHDGTTYQPIGEDRSLPKGIDIRSTTRSSLGFTPRGTATPGTGGTVKLCNSKDSGANVVVSSTGRIRICVPNSCNGTC